MSSKAEVIGREKVMKGLLEYGAAFAKKAVEATEYVQSLVVTQAKANHGANAHNVARFETQTGQLEASIVPLPVALKGTVIEGPVMAGQPYAGFVEYGTSKSRAYPFLGPALMANEKPYVKYLKKALRESGSAQR